MTMTLKTSSLIIYKLILSALPGSIAMIVFQNASGAEATNCVTGQIVLQTLNKRIRGGDFIG